MGVQPNQPREEYRNVPAVMAWTHAYGPANTRVFGFTLAHFESEMTDSYFDVLSRGVAWATRHINDDGTFAEGYAADK